MWFGVLFEDFGNVDGWIEGSLVWWFLIVMFVYDVELEINYCGGWVDEFSKFNLFLFVEWDWESFGLVCDVFGWLEGFDEELLEVLFELIGVNYVIDDEMGNLDILMFVGFIELFVCFIIFE